jgi:hypothetical protein
MIWWLIGCAFFLGSAAEIRVPGSWFLWRKPPSSGASSGGARL